MENNYKKSDIVRIRLWSELKSKRDDYPLIMDSMIPCCGRTTMLISQSVRGGSWLCENGWNWSESWFVSNDFLSDEDFEI